jgi:hypothetical protein
MCGKENDELRIAEENEELFNDTINTGRARNRAMEITREIARRNIERLREEYIQANMDMCVGDMDLVNDVFEFIRERA